MFVKPSSSSSVLPQNSVALTVPPKVIAGKPVRIVIPSLNIDLPVEDGKFNPEDSSWTLSGNRAHYALPSPLANNTKGSTVIYGHNNKYVFGPMEHIQSSEVAQVHTDNGRIFEYKFINSEEVTPENVAIFHYQGPAMLAVQTCSGDWFELRHMFYFGLERVIEP
jgi:LPXTG-site transpeptidase (sortase) family protein